MIERAGFPNLISLVVYERIDVGIIVRRSIWIGFVLVALAVVSAAWILRGFMAQPSNEGFRLVFLKTNEVLISDANVLSYNWTSQEIVISDAASERLLAKGDSLYTYDDGFVIRIDGEEVYHGIFRLAVHSAVPESPRISILFPSMLFPSTAEDSKAIRMFYPWFEPPSGQAEQNAKLLDYFESTNKLIY